MILPHFTYTGVAELLNELDKLAEMFIGDINATEYKETVMEILQSMVMTDWFE